MVLPLSLALFSTSSSPVAASGGARLERERRYILRQFQRRGVRFVCAATSDGNGDVLELRGWQWGRTTKELAAYGALLVAVPVVPLLPRFEWSAAIYFTSLSLWTVYVGSHRSLARQQTQQVSFKQGLAAPVLCSISLFGFYCLLRFFPELDLRTFISIYLSCAGAFAVANNLTNPLKLLFPRLDSLPVRINVPSWLASDKGKPVCLTVTAADIIALLAGIGVAYASKQPGAPFTFNNLMAVCIVTELLQLLSVGSFSTAAVMLCGLLLYDVFWVFGSSQIFGDNVMVTVATSSAFDGPVKLVFPSWKAEVAHPESILGLGDIAAPGLLIALMLRFDQARCAGLQNNTIPAAPQKTYFSNSVIAYVAGLTLTVVANSVSGAAQPALLYLVPCLLSSAILTALSKSEAPLLFSYKDERPPDDEAQL
ncbi:signal peptide peptidase 2 [Selaginella moellendorffii]|nr:signal peptide peptidase 2 [Selaginella moellendorffii]|eukprot:XP_002990953.2 signal peptide peptidase 2 [Selaginella moellendorffii]